MAVFSLTACPDFSLPLVELHALASPGDGEDTWVRGWDHPATVHLCGNRQPAKNDPALNVNSTETEKP